MAQFPEFWELAPTGYDEEKGKWLFWQKNTGEGFYIKCPYGQVGDRLWVRETWRSLDIYNWMKPSLLPHRIDQIYYFDSPELDGLGKWRPSIFMPRWASRIERIITGLRPERLRDITEEDAIAEGIVETSYTLPWGKLTAYGEYMLLWDAINGKKYPWTGNWWVWAISF